ncbi:hypothetical protein JZ751_007983 [Albula glossodonta]|uniref:Uncharacterized protein n=1 Tax=Albula glossodonta TaxID=121402 RepID=A0A8T2P0P9_9TELE|nr:hypothetical protein JZ751_007983 [Albula glossodonta]
MSLLPQSAPPPPPFSKLIDGPCLNLCNFTLHQNKPRNKGAVGGESERGNISEPSVMSESHAGAGAKAKTPRAAGTIWTCV